MLIKPIAKLFRRKADTVLPATMPAALAEECMEFVARQFGNGQSVDVVQATLEEFKECSVEQKTMQFGRAYFRLEKFIIALGGSQAITVDGIRSRLFREMPEAAQYPPFDLCRQSQVKQEFLQCRYFLLLVAITACGMAKANEKKLLTDIIEWLNGLGESHSWPPPLKVLTSEPSDVATWTKALEQVNGTLQLRLKSILGEYEMLELYEAAFETASGTFKGLRSFTIVYGLLPRMLLDDEKLAILENRHELQERLISLEQTNLELVQANTALQQTKKALSRAQQQAESNEHLVSRLLDTAGEAIFGIKPDGEILFVNEIAASIWGYSRTALSFLNFYELLDLESREFFSDYAKRNDAEKSSWMILTGCREDGSYLPVKLHAHRTFDSEFNMITVAIRDLTTSLQQELEEKKLRDKLEHAERMESIGLLAGGVAHDLNNILGPLVVYPDLILETIAPDHEIREDVEEIGKSAQRAAAIIQDLLTMSRKGHYDFKAVSLNKVIQDFLSSPEFNNPLEQSGNIALHVDLEKNAPLVRGSEHHLLKIFLNLCINAMDAMTLGGTLSITTEYQRDDHSLASEDEDAEEFGCMVCRVRDTGEGIPDEHIKRIFEPFYSTKKLGRSGSGLGLSVVYGVIQDLGGDLEVNSSVGIGTEFCIRFPVVFGESVPDVEGKRLPEPTGDEHILIIDDEVSQLKLASRLLGSLGYTVDCVASGRSGIDYMQQAKVDFVLLDMMIEDGFDGLDTFQVIHEYWPDTVCLIASGYSESDRVKEAIELGAAGFISKPYSKKDLALAVRGALDNKPVRA